MTAVEAIDPRNVPIFIGWSPEEMRAWNIAQASIRRHAEGWREIHRISRLELEAKQLYTRATHVRGDKRWDVVSEAPMTTDHAIARFFVPLLCQYKGWAVFMDGDVMLRRNLDELIAFADPAYAVMCVQHDYEQLSPWTTKKDGQPQVQYKRKNWSSVMLFNCAHLANRQLHAGYLNTTPGRDLHRFAWLDDREIGALPSMWNYLVNVSAPQDDPALVHFTLGTPDLRDVQHSPFDTEWFDYARMCGYHMAQNVRTTL